MTNIFNDDGTYAKTEWKTGDTITADKLDKIESCLAVIVDNNNDRYDTIDSRINELDGTVDSRINELDENVDSRINELDDKKVNYLDLYKNKNVAVCVGYSIVNKKPGLFITYDGINISRIDMLDNFLTSKWDYGLTFLDGYFYTCCDYIDTKYNDYDSLDTSFFLGGNRICVSRTKDFVNFEHWNLELPSEYKQIFSPKFFIDGADLYITVTMGKCDETTIDAWGKEGYKKYFYLVKLNDEFRSVRWVNIVDLTDSSGLNGTCKIDPYIIKHDGYYNLFIKNEDGDYIQQYRSTSVGSGYALVNEFKGHGKCEGPCAYYLDNEFIFMQYDHETKYNMIFKSSDLTEWSGPFVCDIYGDSAIMNASFLVCDSDETKNVIYDYIKNKGYKPFSDDYTKNYSYRMFNQVQEIKKDCDLVLVPNTLYVIKGATNADVTLNLENMFIGDKVYFSVLSGDSNARLRIAQDSRVFFNGEQGSLILNNNYRNDILTLTCLNYKKESIISGVHSIVQEQGFTDTNTGLTFIFYKNNRNVTVVVYGLFKKTIQSNLASVCSFTVPEKFRPISYSFNSYLLGNGEYNNMKITSEGIVEIIVSREVVANSTYFECSTSYLTRG